MVSSTSMLSSMLKRTIKNGYRVFPCFIGGSMAIFQATIVIIVCIIKIKNNKYLPQNTFDVDLCAAKETNVICDHRIFCSRMFCRANQQSR